MKPRTTDWNDISNLGLYLSAECRALLRECFGVEHTDVDSNPEKSRLRFVADAEGSDIELWNLETCKAHRLTESSALN